MAKEETPSIFGKIDVLVVTTIIIALDLVIKGFVLSHLWAWFFVPILNLPLLSFKQAIGISLTAGFLTKKFSTAKEEEDKFKLFKKLLKESFVGPFLILTVGYIVHLMM